MQQEIQLLIKAAYNYYRLGNSIISDDNYDLLYQKVKEWEVKNDIQDKITEKVCLGYFEGDSTVKVPHKNPMISIEKDNTRAIEKETVISVKLDGVALELEYIKGHLYRKITRGDGLEGSDVTKAIIHQIPERLPTNDTFEIRGEVLCPSFEEYGKVHRNVVAGALGKVDFTEDRNLQFVSYWTSLGVTDELQEYTDELMYLNNLGFAVVPYIVSARPFNITQNLIKHNYPSDGYVLRENDNRNAGDKTAHHFKNMWAYKFAAETKQTTIIDVDWKASKNGFFTPVAILEPVVIDGTTVSRVTLNNLDYIKERDICINDTVLIHKAKDIIPEIKKVLERPENRVPILLITCPKCGGDLEMQGIRLTCTNLLCSVNLYIEHFAKTIGIKGLAIKSIEKLNLSHPLDLYDLNAKFYENKLGKNGIKIHNQIQESKNVDIVKLLCALNIPAVKSTILTRIFKEEPDIKVLGNYDKLVKIAGIGDITASTLVKWYKNFEVIILPICEHIGFDITVKKAPVCKLSIAVTGTLPMSRKVFTQNMLIKGILVKSLTKQTTMLITGNNPGKGNLDKAIKYSVPIVAYHNFIRDLNS